MNKDLDVIHHVAIQVRNIAAAVKWYRENFKCEIEYEDASWASLKFANASVALVLPEQHPAHFAVLRENIEQFGQPKLHRDGTSSVYIEDTDNNAVELLKL